MQLNYLNIKVRFNSRDELKKVKTKLPLGETVP